MRFLILVFLLSCGGSSSKYTYFPAEQKDFEKFINPKPQPAKPNLAADVTLLNRDYPIEIAIYQDNTWYYDLPNLDTGKGTWTHEDGKIVLKAERDLFNMKIDVVAIEEKAEDIVIEFIDRYGQEILTVEKKNL